MHLLIVDALLDLSVLNYVIAFHAEVFPGDESRTQNHIDRWLVDRRLTLGDSSVSSHALDIYQTQQHAPRAKQ